MIKTLDWDSKLFGYPVGLLELEGETLHEQTLGKEAASFRLVYVTSNSPQHCSILSSGDAKYVFAKAPQNHGLDQEVVEISIEKTNRAIDIGLQSGLYSRFFLDKRFVNNEFEKLYRTWVKRSIEKEIAYKTLTVLRADEPSGIITLGQSNEPESSIGLFAVGSEYRGQGIGRKLLETADSVSFDRGNKLLTVATQRKNKSACEVYRRFGFELISETYIYNYWNEAFTVQ